MAILSSDHVKMTSLLEKIISVIAPHLCIKCGKYNNVLCTACTHSMQLLGVPFCLFCGNKTSSWAPCRRCTAAEIDAAWAAASYAGDIKLLVHALKFEHARAAYEPLAELIARQVSQCEGFLVVPIPTAPSRMRQRGYDHAALIARRFAQLKKMSYSPILARRSETRQVGAGRRERSLQAADAFVCRKDVKDKDILLIDDVCTTGSTIMSAATVLRRAGARRVRVAVVAWTAPTTPNEK